MRATSFFKTASNAKIKQLISKVKGNGAARIKDDPKNSYLQHRNGLTISLAPNIFVFILRFYIYLINQIMLIGPTANKPLGNLQLKPNKQSHETKRDRSGASIY